MALWSQPPPRRPTRKGVVPNLDDWLKERDEQPFQTFADPTPAEQTYRELEQRDRAEER